MFFVNNKNMKIKTMKKTIKLILPVIILLVVSILNMYGASYISPLYQNHFEKQIIWIFVCLIFSYILYKIDLRFFFKNSFYFYTLGIASLILVLFLGHNVNGASSWFKIGGFTFQPSELFKFFFIVHLSKVISKHKGNSISLFLKVLILTLVPAILIFLEPDTGVVIMYALLMIGMLLASKIPKKYFYVFSGLVILLIGSFLGLYFTQKELFIDIFGTSFFYRMDRLLSFTSQSGYQLENALIGLGASGTFGMGLTSEKVYVPEIVTDFVFVLTICNFGFLIGIFIILLYFYILISVYQLYKNSKKYRDRCILLGVFFMMAFQVWEHIFMNIGLAPITGITLPFLSYGGSSLLSYSMIYVLILKITTSNSSYN